MSVKICLMLTTKENRKYFISRKYAKSIAEFAKNNNYELSIVKTESKNIINISNFAKSICNQAHTESNAKYVVMKKGLTSNKNKTNKTETIRNLIEKIFIENRKASLQEISKLFYEQKISASSLSIHFAHVRKNLSLRGFHIEMIKRGTYAIKS